MIFEFSRIETLEGVTRTPLNQYDSVIRPLETYLRKAGVNFRENCEVTDIDFTDGPGITAKTLYLKKKVESADDSGEEADAPAETSYVTEEVQLNKSDICIMTNACMTDSATLGSLYKPEMCIRDSLCQRSGCLRTRRRHASGCQADNQKQG